MLSQLRNGLKALLGSSPPRRRAPKLGVSFGLETLESRVVPATVVWEANVSSDGEDPDNWSTGTLPTYLDDVVFDGSVTTANCNLGGAMAGGALYSLSMSDDYTGTVTIGAESTIGAGGLQMDGGTLVSTGLTVTGDSNWSGGTITAAIFEVVGVALMAIEGLPKNTNAPIKLTNGQMSIVGSDDVNFRNGAGIEIDSNSTLAFLGTGGLWVPTGQTGGIISNQGLVAKFTENVVFSKLPLVQSSGETRIDRGVLEFLSSGALNEVTINGGKLNLYSNASLSVAHNLLIDGGSLETTGAAAAIIYGDVSVPVGTINLNGTNAVGELEVNGRFNMGTSCVYESTTDATTILSDYIFASDQLWIDGTLSNTVINVPGSGFPLGEKWWLARGSSRIGSWHSVFEGSPHLSVFYDTVRGGLKS